MAKRWFECPDGQNVEIVDCLKDCRMPVRCMSLPSLIVVGEDRKWKGHVSPSMAGSGERQYFLKQTVDYSINPREATFMLYGTKHHALKEKAAEGINAFLEENVSMDGASGTTDYFDGDLIDYKFSGSFAFAKRAVFEDYVVGEYKVNSKYGRKGDPKYAKKFLRWDIKDDDEWALQLNYYALMWEEAGYEVNNIYIEGTLRDGGLVSVRKGFHRKVYMIPVPRIPKETVMIFYNAKQKILEHAFDTMECPPICNEVERWENDRKCLDYCDVWASCIDKGMPDGLGDKIWEHKEEYHPR